MKLIPLLSNEDEIDDYRNMEAKIELATPIGILFSDNVILFEHSNHVGIEIGTIKRIDFIKKKAVIYNLLSLAFGLGLGYLIYHRSFTLLEQLLIGSIGLFFLLLSYFIDDTRYILVVNRTNYSFIEIKVNKRDKKMVKKLVARISNKMKKREGYRS